MTRYGTWVSYQGDARAVLAIGLLLAACVAAVAGSRLRSPQRFDVGWRPPAGVLIAVWIAAIIAFLVGFSLYAQQESHDYPQMTTPPTPILPVTLTAAVVTAILVAAATTGSRRDRIANGVIAALVAPMIFELPFDLVVMARTYPPLSPHPVLYRALFFGPLVLVELTTTALLALAPGAVWSRVAVETVAAMLAVFAGWALVGFAFPSTPATFAFNASSKLLAFLAVGGLFLPQWPRDALERLHLRRPTPGRVHQ